MSSNTFMFYYSQDLSKIITNVALTCDIKLQVSQMSAK